MRAMRITEKNVGEVNVFAIAGKLDTHSSPEAQDRLTALIDGGATKIVVDFSECDYISSVGFRVLLVTAKQLQRDGGTLRLCGITGNVKEVFDISGFGVVFEIFENEAAALVDF
jgi:anti-anti-sigma factor